MTLNLSTEQFTDTELPKGWVETTLGEICSKPQYGWTTKASKAGSVHLLRTTDITSGTVNWDSVPFCSEEPDEVSKYLLHDGDIVISRAGSVGISHLVQKPEYSVFASYLIRFKSLVDNKYVAYFLQSPTYWRAIAEHSSGIALLNVNAKKLQQIGFPLPPLNEQRRIVEKIEELFTRLDAGVEALKHAKAQLKQYRQSVLNAAVTGELSRRWREAHSSEVEPASELLERILEERREKWSGKKYKEPRLPEPLELPSSWQLASIDQIAINYDGKRIPVKRADRDNMEGEYPYYGASGIIDYVDDYLFEGTHLLIAEDGANLLARATPIAFEATGKFWVNNHAHIVQTYADIPLRYVEFCLESISLKPYVTGTAQPKLTQANMGRIPVPLAPLEEQHYIVSEVERRFSVIDRLESTIEDSLKRSESLRQSILKRAFSGGLVEQDLDDEPASALLERIREERQATDKKVTKGKKGRSKKAATAEEPSLFSGSEG